MKFKDSLIQFLITFVVVFVISVMVIRILNFFWYGKGAFDSSDWRMIFYFTITLSIALPLLQAWGIRK